MSEGSYRLGTNKKWHIKEALCMVTVYRVGVCEGKPVTADKVPQVEISICSAATDQSIGTGQGLQPVTREAQVCFHASPRWICGRQSGNATNFSPSTLDFLCQDHQPVLHTHPSITDVIYSSQLR
jgi:hypothetical protein